MKQLIQHHGCPLHVYCRLRDLGISKPTAMLYCSRYEWWIYRPLVLKGGEYMNTLLYWLSTVNVGEVIRYTAIGVVALTAVSFLFW